MPPLAQSYFAPVRLGMEMQYQFMNTVTMGMLDDIAAEIEHALVEGRDVTNAFLEQIQRLQQSQLSAEQRQLLAQTRLNEAEQNLQQIIKELVVNLMQLPFSRMNGKPARKRFAVTLEGQVIKDA